MSILNLIIFSGILSIIYGFWAGNSVLKSNPGSEKMQEISSAIQIGAQAYLNRQYTTIAIVGAVICVLLYLFFRALSLSNKLSSFVTVFFFAIFFENFPINLTL